MFKSSLWHQTLHLKPFPFLQEDKDGSLEKPLLHDADGAGDDAESAPGEPGLADVSFLHKIGAIFATEGAPVFFFMASLMGAAC